MPFRPAAALRALQPVAGGLLVCWRRRRWRPGLTAACGQRGPPLRRWPGWWS